MTDPEMADRTYIEPLTVEAVTAVIAQGAARRDAAHRGRADGARTSRWRSHEAGVLDEYGVKLIGANDRRDQGRRRSAAVP